MTVLSRHLGRSLAGPYLFCFSLLTGLMYIQSVAKLLDDFAGKGLPSEVILEVLLLTLPHTLALTLPMAVLPAVLYAYSELAAANETVAMAGGGVQPRRVLLPALVLGVLVAGVTYTFNDRVLPETNHRLKNLQGSIHRKSPTFQLRERAVNVIRDGNGPGKYFLSADRIDPVANALGNVVIHDLSRTGARRTTYAASGEMALNDSATVLHLRLRDGHAYEVKTRDAAALQRTEFEEQLYVLRGIGDVFEELGESRRSDRELPLADLRDSAQARARAADSVRFAARTAARASVERALGLDADGQPPSAGMAKGFASVDADQLPSDEATRRTLSETQAHALRLGILSRQSSRFSVEYHKKLVLAAASIAFVLIAAPLGMRFPRGGINMVIVVSAVVFGAAQWGLSSGETRADRELASPFWSMWMVSLILLAVGTLFVSRTGHWTATARDSGWRELWLGLRNRIHRSIRKPSVAPEPGS